MNSNRSPNCLFSIPISFTPPPDLSSKKKLAAAAGAIKKEADAAATTTRQKKCSHCREIYFGRRRDHAANCVESALASTKSDDETVRVWAEARRNAKVQGHESPSDYADQHEYCHDSNEQGY